ncbi:hypothetical protein [Legionella parisiensis]|uniref:Uncharacterized protein n=1 Tax=Legionella parisiensis TaxID=45071 RepID=A0A1E5JM67_9GAMM|nr:hypothetical protein [Legionella parisiensis]KTD43051.1 hypothetical protein Lpar_1028 [Legionella parisiensis]OEH45128.1 hypothetical protein lpari_03898 [Legionella parisiensis]STX77870.1 Uncharacterised protein [Legionella parisiensis]
MPFPTLISVNDWRSKTKRNPDKEVERMLGNVYDAKTIYTRFDHLTELLDYAESKPHNQTYGDLSSSILSVLGHLLNESDPDKIREKIAARQLLKDLDPYYMPWTRPNPGDASNDPFAFYQTIQHRSKDQQIAAFAQFKQNLKESDNLLTLGGRKSDTGNNFWAYRQEKEVEEKAYNEEELEQFRALPHQGKLIKLVTSGSKDNRHLTFEPFSTNKLTIKGYDTMMLATKDYPKRGIYTVHVNGSIFVGQSVAPQRTNEWFIFNPYAILHPSYADSYSDLPLFMAGQIEVSDDGDVMMLDSASGHFVPDYEQTQQANTFLREELHIVNNFTKVTYFRPVGRGKREFDDADVNCSELKAMIKDYIVIKHLDARLLSFEYLRDNAPKLYVYATMQDKIHSELFQWRKDSKEFFSFTSPFTPIDKAVEKFSKRARYQDPDATLELLFEVQQTIDTWKEEHEGAKLSSQRQHAVNSLENRIQGHILYYQSKQLLSDLKSIPVPYDKIMGDFISGTKDLSQTIDRIERLPEFKEQNKLNFFAAGAPEKDNSVITSIAALLCASKNASTAKLKEINRELLDYQTQLTASHALTM